MADQHAALEPLVAPPSGLRSCCSASSLSPSMAPLVGRSFLSITLVGHLRLLLINAVHDGAKTFDELRWCEFFRVVSQARRVETRRIERAECCRERLWSRLVEKDAAFAFHDRFERARAAIGR